MNPRTPRGSASATGSQAGAELLGTPRRSWCLSRTWGTAVPTVCGRAGSGVGNLLSASPKRPLVRQGGNSRYAAEVHSSTKRCPCRMQPRCRPCLRCPQGQPRPPEAPVPPGAQGVRRNRVTSPPRCSHISFNSNIRVLNIHREIGIGSHLQCFQIHSFEVQRQIKKNTPE